MKEDYPGSYCPITLSFHATPECLQNWDYHQTVGKRANTLPPFSNVIALPPNVKLQMSHQLQLINIESHHNKIKTQPLISSYEHVPGKYFLGKKS